MTRPFQNNTQNNEIFRIINVADSQSIQETEAKTPSLPKKNLFFLFN